MAGESIMDKMKAKLARLREGRHSSAAPGTAGVRMPAVAAMGTGSSPLDDPEKPSILARIKFKLSGGKEPSSDGPSAPT